ncbi:MAG: phage tail tape measure protein [Prevotella sp.]|nr:phage tail tape measure protein [Prevotella sp.]
MDEANTVVDVYSNLAANAAATVEDIATAMTATASIAANAGMTYENTAAYLAKIIETTQESASSIGTSLKTIIANFTQMTTNVSNDEADAELSINSTDEALQSVGISLRDAQGQIKNLDVVIDELGNSWNNLDRNTQRYLATTIAGTRQQSRLIALLDDYDRTLELEAEATDSAGKSDAQFSKYTDTLAYSSQKLSTEMEELKQKFVTDNIMSSIYKALSSLITGLNNLPTGAIAALALGIVALGKKILSSILTPIKESTQAWREMSKELKEKH